MEYDSDMLHRKLVSMTPYEREAVAWHVNADQPNWAALYVLMMDLEERKRVAMPYPALPKDAPIHVHTEAELRRMRNKMMAEDLVVPFPEVSSAA